MKYIGRLLGWILLAANLLWVCGLLFCAYSPYIDPVRHPMQACAGLAFPVFLLGTVLFLLFWLVVYYRYALVALGGRLCCLPAIRTYCPLNFGREEAPDGAIKFLSYNVMGFDADHPDTPDNPNLVLAYLRDSGADILCLQEYIRGGRLKQSHIDRVLSAYPYKDVRRVGKGGNHLACAAAIAVLDVMERDGLVENAATVGEYLLGELHKIGGLKEVRGRGLMIGIELDGSGSEFRKRLLFEKHIFTGGAGASTVRLLPALCLTRELADRFLNAFKELVR